MAVVHDGSIYHLGGMDGSGFNAVSMSWLLAANGVWEEIAPIPEPVGAGAAAVVGGMIYLAGGVPSGTHVWIYDPADDSWRAGPAMNERREHIAAVSFEGKLWVLGGRWGNQMHQSVEVFDPGTEEWSEGPPMLEARSGFGATVIGDRIVVAGGEVFSPTKALATTEVLVEGRWESGPALPQPLHGVPLVTVDDAIFVVGGSVTAAEVDNPGEVWSLRP
jgi:non-specific serine/threonine protein kinase